MEKRVCVMCGLFLLLGLTFNQSVQAQSSNINTNPYFATSSRYDYIYANPPRQGLKVYGRYIFSNSKVRYVHSPSRLKGAKHAARINANNAYYAYGW